MKNNNISITKFELDQRMLHIVMQHANSMSDLGFFSGRMGLIVFFLHYYRYTQCKVYEDIADNLMDGVLDKIHKKTLMNFSSGLAGIGWVIEYLIQNEFMEGDSLEVCREIDYMIMKKDPRRLHDYSLEIGLEGLLHYVLAHLQGVNKTTTEQPFDSIYLDDLFSAVTALDKEKTTKNMQVLVEKYIAFYQGKKMDYTMDIKPFLRKDNISEKVLLDTPIGIKDGISGVLLNKILI